jgi:hypothetical protein
LRGTFLTFGDLESRAARSGWSIVTPREDYTSQKDLILKCLGCGLEKLFYTTIFTKKFGCRACSILERRKPYSEIQAIFKDAGCELLTSASEYQNPEHLRYLCDCGRESSTRLSHFLKGSRCRECNNERQSQRLQGSMFGKVGNLHPLWRRNRSKKIRGDDFEEKEWRKLVLKQDEFRCRACGNNKNLQAHHIQNYSSSKELRYDTNNGITFCEFCHFRFHEWYGRFNNNLGQVLDYIRIIQKQLSLIPGAN